MPPYLNNFQQLRFIYAAIPILVIHFECPPQLVFQFPSQDKVQGSHILQKIDGVILEKQKQQLSDTQQAAAGEKLPKRECREQSFATSQQICTSPATALHQG